jgi:alcohol dehydrogenase (cytochrome c)
MNRDDRATPFRLSVLLFAGLLFAILALVAGPSPAAGQQQPMAARIEHADKEPQNWLTFYGNYAGWSYSPLNQITRENVKQLVPVWAFPAGISPTNTSLRQGLEAAPIVADGVLYLVGMQNNVYAIEAATGRTIWTYTYQWPEKGVPLGPRGARGLAIGDGRIYMGTQDNHVVALDAETGNQVWNVEVEDASTCRCGITSPPLFVKGKIITGNAGGGIGYMRGYVNAFDARTGERVWHFDVIPSPGQPGSETWSGSGDAWKTGGGAPWFTGTYDPELNLTFWGTGDPSPTYKEDDRPGDNLYSTSVVALDADTGKLKWYFQETSHDMYDYDSAMEPMLLEANLEGRRRKIILHPSKNGFVYVYDRETGKLLRTFPYGSPTWTKGLDADGKPIDQVVPKLQSDFLICPAMGSGARGINHSAYSPRTGWWYTTDFESCTRVMGGGRPNQDALNPQTPPNISAYDPATGKKQWSFNTKYFNVSSLLATAGDLIFAGDLEGNAFALDARTGRKLWSFNTGARITSPPVSFSVGGRQFVTFSAGGGTSTENLVPKLWPESRGRLPQPASTLFVFALPEKGK